MASILDKNFRTLPLPQANLKNTSLQKTRHIEGLWVSYIKGKSKKLKLKSESKDIALSPLRGFGGHNPFGLPLAGLTTLGNPEYAYFFTGKELYEDEALQWYDYGARMYDVQIGRWTSHDPLCQFASPYDYCGGDPINYIDPDGRFATTSLALATGQLWALPFTIYFDFFTETGYDVQKFLSPIAVNIDVRFGTHQRGLGVNTSIGVPQIMPLNIRVHGGVTYYTKNYGATPGWEKRYGAEVGITAFVRVGFTEFDSPGEKFDQRLGHVTIGVPGANVKYANDWMFGSKLGDDGDRHRTAAAKINLGPFSMQLNLFTGDPGLDENKRGVDVNKGGSNGEGEYIQNEFGDDPDEYRNGVLSFGIGPFSIGYDSENIRNFVQNYTVHKWISDSPYFKKTNKNSSFFFQTNSSWLW